jgi:hypothetical protein
MGKLTYSGMYASVGISIDVCRKMLPLDSNLIILTSCFCRTFDRHYLAVKEVEYWLIWSGPTPPVASLKVFSDSLIRVVCDVLIASK